MLLSLTSAKLSRSSHFHTSSDRKLTISRGNMVLVLGHPYDEPGSPPPGFPYQPVGLQVGPRTCLKSFLWAGTQVGKGKHRTS